MSWKTRATRKFFVGDRVVLRERPFGAKLPIKKVPATVIEVYYKEDRRGHRQPQVKLQFDGATRIDSYATIRVEHLKEEEQTNG